MLKGLFISNFLFLFTVTCFAQESNPFSVFRQEDTTSLHQKLQQSSLNKTDDTEVNKLVGDNPFTISHIPIRKNQYKKIESLTSANQTLEKETISISYMPLWLSFMSLCLLAFMLFVRRNHINILIRCMLNENFLRMTGNEEKQGKTLHYLIGYSLFLINISLFIVFVLQNIFAFEDNFLWLWTLLFCIVFFIGKHIVGAFFSWVYGFESKLKLYHFLIISYRNILSLVFLALNIVFVFGAHSWNRSVAIIGFSFFLMFLLSRYYKGIKIARSYINSHFFHFFIYFCAFELSPWVITYTVIRDFL